MFCRSLFGFFVCSFFLMLYCLSFDLRFWIPLWHLVVIVLSVLRFTILLTSLVSCGHCIVCSSIYDSGYLFGILWSLYCLSFDLRFWLPLWYLVVIVLYVLRFTILVTSLVSCSHCIVCPSIYGSGYPFGILWSLYCLSIDLRFWLPLWYLVVIVLSVLRFTILITPLISCGHCIVCPSIYDSGYPFGILWSLYCLSFDLRFWLPLWYLVVIVLPVLRFTILVTPLVSCGHCIVCPSIYDSGYLFGIL
jgi:hypothetical protein